LEEQKVFGSRVRSLKEDMLGKDPPISLEVNGKGSHSIKIVRKTPHSMKIVRYVYLLVFIFVLY